MGVPVFEDDFRSTSAAMKSDPCEEQDREVSDRRLTVLSVHAFVEPSGFNLNENWEDSQKALFGWLGNGILRDQRHLGNFFAFMKTIGICGDESLPGVKFLHIPRHS